MLRFLRVNWLRFDRVNWLRWLRVNWLRWLRVTLVEILEGDIGLRPVEGAIG